MGAVLRTGLVAACLAAVVPTAPAHAAFAGANGRIGYYENGDIYTINPDGTGATNLTNDRRADYVSRPVWSADGRRIAFVRLLNTSDDVWLMNADGSGLTRLTSCFNSAYDPAWSPDGTKLAFTNGCGTGSGRDIFVMNADGTNQVNLTNNAAGDSRSAWSPGGTKIAFVSSRDNSAGTQIYTMNPDGSGQTRITSLAAQFNGSPDWSPDGSRIVFESGSDVLGLDVYTMKPDGTEVTKLNVAPALRVQSGPVWSPDGRKIVFPACTPPPPGGDCFPHLYTVDSDGSQLTQITTAGFQFVPGWQPLPQNYARPKGATPLRASLVPAFRQCTAPNTTHGSPLGFPSCQPSPSTDAWVTSDYLVVGAPDANGAAANSVGSLRLDVKPGAMGPPEDSDVNIALATTDVRCKNTTSASLCTANNVAGGRDYAGELRGSLGVRLTDRYNGTSTNETATVEDFAFSFDATCSTTDTSIGSACGVTTSMNAVVAGAIKDTQRAVWQLDQVQVYDGGSDGMAATTGDDTLFMDQGVFIP